MYSKRQNKIARQLQKDLSEIIQQGGNEIVPGKMVSITIVRVSPDFSFAKVYVSIFPANNIEADFKELKTHVKNIRHLLSQRVKNQIRKVPEIAFYIDDSLDYAEKIDDLLKQ